MRSIALIVALAAAVQAEALESASPPARSITRPAIRAKQPSLVDAKKRIQKPTPLIAAKAAAVAPSKPPSWKWYVYRLEYFLIIATNTHRFFFISSRAGPSSPTGSASSRSA